MNPIRQKDMIFGAKSEDETMPILNSFFREEITKTKHYDVMDFQSKSYWLELKARTCSYSKYPDTMIGLNKLEFARQSTKPVFFIFKFTDGLYYWRYREKKEALEVRFDTGGRNDRERPEFKPYAYIICKYLKSVL